MGDGVEFEEMVFAAITGDFELGAEADDGAGFFSPRNGFLDVVHIAIEIHCPLIQVAGGYLEKPHSPPNSMQVAGKSKVEQLEREREGEGVGGEYMA